MDYIFKKWGEIIKQLVEKTPKTVEDIKKSKLDFQKLALSSTAEMQKGRYIRDDRRLIISAPEIIIGNVDASGNLIEGATTVVIRGTQVSMQGAGNSGTIDLRAPVIHQIAEDPGIDGNEHVVGTISEVASQARNIIIQSNDNTGAFASPIIPSSGCGVRIHADKVIEVDAAMTAESLEKRIDQLISTREKERDDYKEQIKKLQQSFDDLVKEIEKNMDDRDKLMEKEDSIRTNYNDVRNINSDIEALSMSITEQAYALNGLVALLSETNRQIDCYKAEKSKIVKGEDFKKKTTGARINLTGETINLLSADGEGNWRDNKESGISMIANRTNLFAIEKDGKLKKNGSVIVQAKNFEVTTAGMTDAQADDKGVTTKATYTAEGNISLTAKNVTVGGIDYEIADKKLKEKGLTADSKIKLRAKTIEVSTEGSANIENDEKGKIKKATMTAEGDIIVKSKTFTLESTDTDIEDGKPKEKALTKDGKVSIRAEKMDLSSTDTEGKATGSIHVNAKAVAVKSMDVEKEKRTDDKLAEGGSMTLVAEKMYVGAKSKDVKSKQVQVVSEEIGGFADKTLEIQQDNGKATVQLSDGNVALGGSKAEVYGATTINGATEVKGEVKAPQATIDNLEAKTSFKSTNISDGVAVSAPAASASLSAKLKAEDAPKEE